MFQKILVPLDGSDEAADALPVAASMARQFGAALLLIDMVPTGGADLALAADVASGAMSDPGAITTEMEVREQVAEGYVSAMAEQLAAQGISTSYAVGRGDEGGGIVEAAQREHVDLIVMATHARGPLGRLFFGSVSDDVMRHAPVPVLVVPPGDHANEAT